MSKPFKGVINALVQAVWNTYDERDAAGAAEPGPSRNGSPGMMHPTTDQQAHRLAVVRQG